MCTRHGGRRVWERVFGGLSNFIFGAAARTNQSYANILPRRQGKMSHRRKKKRVTIKTDQKVGTSGGVALLLAGDIVESAAAKVARGLLR